MQLWPRFTPMLVWSPPGPTLPLSPETKLLLERLSVFWLHTAHAWGQAGLNTSLLRKHKEKPKPADRGDCKLVYMGVNQVQFKKFKQNTTICCFFFVFSAGKDLHSQCKCNFSLTSRGHRSAESFWSRVFESTFVYRNIMIFVRSSAFTLSNLDIHLKNSPADYSVHRQVTRERHVKQNVIICWCFLACDQLKTVQIEYVMFYTQLSPEVYSGVQCQHLHWFVTEKKVCVSECVCRQKEEAEIHRFLVSFCKLFRLYFLHLDQLSVEAWTCRLSSNPPPEQSLPCPLSRGRKRNVHIFSTQSLAQTWNQSTASSRLHVHNKDEPVSYV